MGKRKKNKNKHKRAYYEKQRYYNEVFKDSFAEPGDVRKIAIQVFGSTYFTTKDLVD
jgi:hypothetical protein